MFGYITINKDELKLKDYNQYRAYYCGLCRELGKRHGALARLALTYDMTFLVILLTALYEPRTVRSVRRCGLHPARKQPELSNRFTKYAADMDILLSYYNLQDDWKDERRLPSLAMSQALKKASLHVEKQYPRQASAVRQYMVRLSKCERAQDKSLDAASGLTGELLRVIFAPRQDEWQEGLGRLGFYLGKFIYLCDAWEDLDRDKKTGNYNPLAFYKAEPDFQEKVKSILVMMAAECAREFERLPVIAEADILRNILYSGIWTRYMIKQKDGKQNDRSLPCSRSIRERLQR